MRSQRSGVLTTRSDERRACVLEEPRDDLVGRDHEVFDQLGRLVLLLGLQARRLPVAHDRPRLNRLDVEGAVPVALARSALAARFCSVSCACRSGDVATFGGGAAGPSSHAPTAL